MKRDQINQYCALLEKVKLRVRFVEDVLENRQGWPEVVRDEVVHLQFRKILEAIAFSSLVSNREAFSKTYKKFAKYWNAADLLKDLSRINPEFYPQPVVQKLTKGGVPNFHLERRTRGVLTKHDFVSLYGRCGDVLHERNPYAKPLIRRFTLTGYGVWLDRIVNLLDAHIIRLLGDPNVYVIHLNESDGNVHHYTGVPKRT